MRRGKDAVRVERGVRRGKSSVEGVEGSMQRRGTASEIE